MTDEIKPTTTSTPTTSYEFTNMHSLHHRTVTSKVPLSHYMTTLKIETHTSRLLNKITAPNVFNTTLHETSLLTHFNTELQRTKSSINQFTLTTHSTSHTTLSSFNASFLHDSNVSLTSNDPTTISTTRVFNMTDLTTAALEPRNVTDSLSDTTSLGTKHDQLIYIYIISPIVIICMLLSLYVVFKKRSKSQHQPNNHIRMNIYRNPINTPIDGSNDDIDDSIEFEL